MLDMTDEEWRALMEIVRKRFRKTETVKSDKVDELFGVDTTGEDVVR